MQYYDQEEKDLIEKIQSEHDRDQWEIAPQSDELIKSMRKMAKAQNTQKKEAKKSLSIRLQYDVIEKIKQQAELEGLPYQTLISSVLHQFAMGRLQRKDSIL